MGTGNYSNSVRYVLAVLALIPPYYSITKKSLDLLIFFSCFPLRLESFLSIDFLWQLIPSSAISVFIIVALFSENFKALKALELLTSYLGVKLS